MGAAAVVAPVRMRARSTAARGLELDRCGGPLVAVSGLAGGAGTTTLAFLLARQAAAESAEPILLAEAAADRPGLAVLAGRTSSVPLTALARGLAADQVPTGSFTELTPTLRLIAARPTDHRSPDDAALDELLAQARAAHGLVLVDCGTDRTIGNALIKRATHVIWTVPATPSGLASARLLLESAVLPRPGHAREILVALARETKPGVRVRALRRIAQPRCERLVLMPYSRSLAQSEATASLDEGIRRALAGLAATLRRTR